MVGNSLEMKDGLMVEVGLCWEILAWRKMVSWGVKLKVPISESGGGKFGMFLLATESKVEKGREE